MNESNQNWVMRVSNFWKRVSSVYALYVQDAKYKTMIRFFWAWIGSLTLYMPLFTFEQRFRVALDNPLFTFWDNIDGNPLITITILLCLFSSLAIGSMIAISNNKYGAVRLYLSGLMLSSFTLIVVASCYSLWFRDSASSPDAETVRLVIDLLKQNQDSLKQLQQSVEEFKQRFPFP